EERRARSVPRRISADGAVAVADARGARVEHVADVAAAVIPAHAGAAERVGANHRVLSRWFAAERVAHTCVTRVRRACLESLRRVGRAERYAVVEVVPHAIVVRGLAARAAAAGCRALAAVARARVAVGRAAGAAGAGADASDAVRRRSGADRRARAAVG